MPSPRSAARYIRNAESLLYQIADGLKPLEAAGVRMSLGSIQVTFIVGRHQYAFTLVAALAALANDLYWDERGDWSSASTAEVETI